VESADPETTSLIKRVDAPLPPYAQQAGADPSAAVLAPVPPNEVVPAPLPVGAPTAPAAATAAMPTVLPAPTSAAIEVVTCPSCGTTAQVTLNRRESVDFCRNCDYPLFWTPSKIFRDPADMGDDSLRRLPGTVGRATLAALPCPTCSEPNALSAEICVRCGSPMHLVVEEAPPPPPVVVEAPPPAPEPVKKVAWWVWAMLVLGAVALVALIVLITTHTID
jgi:hypothetical protein